MSIKKLDLLVKQRSRLTSFGIGLTTLKQAYARLGINIYNKCNTNFINIRRLITLYKTQEEFIFDEKLLEYVENRRKFLNKLGNYKSLRFNLGLPCNGQRTQTNGRTCKNRRAEIKRETEIKKLKLKAKQKPKKVFYLRDIITNNKKNKKLISKENKWRRH